LGEKETMAEYTLRPGVCPIRPSAVLNGRSFYREPVDTRWADINTPLADGHHHCLSRQHELWAVSKPFCCVTHNHICTLLFSSVQFSFHP